MEKGNKRLAVLVGCNYPNTRNELHGCLNDVLTMKDVLVSRFGFEPANIELLTDAAPGSSVMPTGVNIMDTLYRMVDHAEPGDVLFFHYSGHGTRIPSNHGFKHDEAIVPCDFNLITDVDFRQLVNRLPVGASFTVFSDSCHSGGLIDKEKEQIGPYVADFSTLLPNNRTKIIPYDSIIAHLTSISGIQSSNIGVHLSEVFGNQSSLNTRLGQRESDPLEPLHPDSGILLSGCQANETSADMNPTVEGGKAYGAFSNAVQMVLKENGNKISNRELIIRTREVLQEQGFNQQHPCLYCSDENANAPFLWQPEHEDINRF